MTKNKHQELIIVREFDAPLKRVWEAFTNPEIVKKWWGPKDFTAPVAQIDFRVNGKNLCCMKSKDGKEYWSTGIYKEILPMEKIVVSDSFSDSEGNIISAAQYGMKDFPLELEITETFEELDDGRTKMTLIHKGMPVGEMEEARTGWSESFDKLAESLKK